MKDGRRYSSNALQVLRPRFAARDGLLVLSVGGGDLERNVSPNLVRAIQHGKQVGATVCGIVGRDGGFTAKMADACVIVPTVNPAHVTPHAEAFQAVVWHLFVTHPAIKVAATKWESTVTDNSRKGGIRPRMAAERTEDRQG